MLFLITEVGGYLGIFLGISLFDLRMLAFLVVQKYETKSEGHSEVESVEEKENLEKKNIFKFWSF